MVKINTYTYYKITKFMHTHCSDTSCHSMKEMALIGYGYTRQEVVDLASDYAVDLDI